MPSDFIKWVRIHYFHLFGSSHCPQFCHREPPLDGWLLSCFEMSSSSVEHLPTL